MKPEPKPPIRLRTKYYRKAAALAPGTLDERSVTPSVEAEGQSEDEKVAVVTETEEEEKPEPDMSIGGLFDTLDNSTVLGESVEQPSEPHPPPLPFMAPTRGGPGDASTVRQGPPMEASDLMVPNASVQMSSLEPGRTYAASDRWIARQAEAEPTPPTTADNYQAGAEKRRRRVANP